AAGVLRCRLPVWDCTVGLVTGTGGALLVGAGSSLREGARVRAEAPALAGRRGTPPALPPPPLDHALRAAAVAGPDVVAAAGPADSLGRPGQEVSGALVLDLGGGREAVLVNAGPGHTAQDLAVLIPGDPPVVFCGDLVEESGAPQAGPDAVPYRWPAALDRLLALGGADARYVPGHGAVVDAAFVRAQRDALAARFGVSHRP